MKTICFLDKFFRVSPLKYFVILFLILALHVDKLSAQNSDSKNSNQPKINRGTLPDGTPFRTDLDGTQIVDYIAELEVAVEYLKERVVSLEDELIASRTKISRLESKQDLKGKPQPKLFEKELMSSDGNRATIASSKAQLKKGDTFEVQLDEEKSLLLKEVGNVNSLLSKREDLYQTYINNASSGVTFKLSKPESKSKRQVKELTTAIKNSDSRSTLKSIKIELNYIKKIISDDISLISRLSKG